MATIPVKVLPVAATPNDVELMKNIFKEAFGPDPLIEFCFNQPNTPKPPKEEGIAKELERIADPRFMYHKAVDAEYPDQMLGVSVWYWFEEPQKAAANIPWGDPPPGTHLACFNASIGALRRWRFEHFRDTNEPFIYMALLTVSPEAQRRGVGTALLREGLKEADRRGLPAFIEASPSGLGLYKKFGWEEKVTNVVNLKDFGGEDVDCVTVGLIRPAAGKEGKEAVV